MKFLKYIQSHLFYIYGLILVLIYVAYFFYKLSSGTYTHYDSITPFFVVSQTAIYNYGKDTNFVIQYCIPALNFIIWLCIIL